MLQQSSTGVLFSFPHFSCISLWRVLHFMHIRVCGPALCVYNDAEFTGRDWEGIRMLHTSIKEQDPLKVGRFGLGFKSVFHLTGLWRHHFLFFSFVNSPKFIFRLTSPWRYDFPILFHKLPKLVFHLTGLWRHDLLPLSLIGLWRHDLFPLSLINSQSSSSIW